MLKISAGWEISIGKIKKGNKIMRPSVTLRVRRIATISTDGAPVMHKGKWVVVESALSEDDTLAFNDFGLAIE